MKRDEQQSQPESEPMRPMETTVERVVTIEELDRLSPTRFVGHINSDEWYGFKPETLMILSVKVTSCLDWRSVRVELRLEFDLEKFAFFEPPYRFTVPFTPLMSMGREPARRPE